MIRIAHAPTSRSVKSTALLIEAVKRLQADGFEVELDIIERKPWKECLERKAAADIYFDQTAVAPNPHLPSGYPGGYGNNALEAWGMGIPVITGASDEVLDEMERRFGFLPFYHATEETIYDALRELIEDSQLRERYGQIGYQYIKQWHDYPVVVEQLKALYTKAMGEQESKAA